MAVSRGKSAVMRFMAQIPADIEAKVLRGAARAAGNVVADEARSRANSAEVRDGIVTTTRVEPGKIVAKISVKPGWARSLGIWAEYGTAPHLIRASDAARGGMSVGRINRLDKAAAEEGRTGPGHSLMIGGNFVGEVVRHPGAKDHPFLRPALDVKAAEAFDAAQSFINGRITPAGITGTDDTESEGT